ncbi:Protein TIME FOR COFFEE -like protein [Gossypium arboreum]|uniref:Protein TIME FOR COFFEE-like protein n=1 Tax=Gossypium arboreum TaxID=29729 RepID=A0A0B0P7T9_GOSAR|nr:Protein TIME FOR COFFEE -like protein [Gossypium arboreum]
MDRTREARRVSMASAATTNGLSRRRHRTSSLRDSPEEDGPVETHETARLRDRKKDRDRERERYRERERDRLSRTSKRRRGDRLMSNRGDGGDATKRSHEWASSGGGGGVGVLGGEQIHRQASTSPVRTGVTGALTSPSPAPASPSSSSASMRKKMKPNANGTKQRPPKSSSKSSSSAQEEIEIEIAEVLYGMMRQPQVPSKQEIIGNDSAKFDSREVNKPNNDSKSVVSSPISISPSTLPQSSSILPSNSSSSATPMSAIAPKRKRPRPVKYEDENTTTTTPPPPIFPPRHSSISSTTTKVEIDQPAKVEATSPNLEKNSGPVAENDSGACDLMSSSKAGPVSSELVQAEPVKEEKNNLALDSKPSTEESESRDIGIGNKEESQSPKKESLSSPADNPSSAGLPLDDEREKSTVTKANSTVCENESQREEKFQIDLMAPPPSRSSPEREGETDVGASDPKPVAADVELEMKSLVNEDDKRMKIGKGDVNVEVEDNNKKAQPSAEEADSQKPVVNKERNLDLQLDLEKSDRDSGSGSVSGNKLNHHVQKLHHQHPSVEKTAHSGSLPLPMSIASWPGGLPPMGYMAPLQGVVSMEGSAVSSAAIQACRCPPHLLFSQPRPKRCATHCYIARNIHKHQQMMKMNAFWPAAPGSASLYGPKACNLNVVPPSELHGNIPGRGVNSVQEKGQGLAIFPGHVCKDKSSTAANNMVDAAQRKQIMLQQALPPGAPNNIMQGPAFIFPLNQQAAAASVRPGYVKSPPAACSTAASSTSNSALLSATPAGATAAPAFSFNYPNITGNETQYLAILQNNPYPFPIPAHVGAPPAYRGNHAQPMPFIHGSFYSSSQMLHPSQLQQQQQQQPPTQFQQSQQGHQNTSMSSGSSSSQKNLQNQQQRSHGGDVSSGSGNSQVFHASKKDSPHPLQLRQQQQQPSQNDSHQARQLDGESDGKDGPSTATDSRVSRSNMNIYGQNFAMPVQPSNFALMTAASMNSGGNYGEKKQQTQQQSQQLGSKAGVEPLASQAFAMSFSSPNGTTAPGLGISSLAPSHAILQSHPGSTRQGYQHIMAAQHKKDNYHAYEEGKRGTHDASNVQEEKKAGKSSGTAGQSIAFSRPNMPDSSDSTLAGKNVIDSSICTLGSAPARTSGPVMPASIGSVNVANAQQQLQRNQQQQLQFGTASAPRSKTPATSNGSAYPDHFHSSSIAAKFSNVLSAYPQNLIQSSSSPAQSPQWKNSVRTTSSQIPSQSLPSTSSLKNISQQQGRPQQSPTQISFAANPKSPQGQQPLSSTPSPSPMMVGSPTTSLSRSAGGSPRTTGSSSTSNKGGQASGLSSQQAKNSPTVPSQKSSPIGGSNVPSVLGNPHISSSSNMGAKPQVALPHQQHQKHALHQGQLFFPNAYMQAQAQHSPSSTTPATTASAYYVQRQQQTLPLGSSTTSSTSMLSLCSPVTLANSGTTDPAKAVAAAVASNMKGGLASQGLINPAQFASPQSTGKSHQLVPGFPCVHAVPSAVQVKPAEQKQPAGE